MIGYRPNETEWTPWRCSTYQVRVHVQDLTENIIDRSHFSAVHDVARPERDHFEVRFEGPSMIVEQRVSQDAIEMLTYITQTPIDHEFTEVNLIFSMKALPDKKATEWISELNDRITNEQFMQDVPIWENKIYRERPMITKIDGPVAQYRRWFRQFYSDPD